MAVEDFKYPNIEPTDYIDESREDILARDDAAKHSFRRVSTFPTVTEDDIGMKIYLIGVGVFQLLSAGPDTEPQWKQLTDDKRNAAYTDWVIENYQPISQLLTSLAKLVEAHDAIPYFRGPNDMQSAPLSNFMMDILAETDDVGVRNALGLGTAATLDTPISGSNIADGSIGIDKISNSFKQNLGFTTGDCKLTYKRTADEGWILLDDGSIGNIGSGATTRANADTYDLYMTMWDIPICTVQSFSGAPSTKTTAIQDWSANKRLILPKVLGRALAIAGQGEGLSKRDLGSIFGEEQTQLGVENIPSHNHALLLNGNDYGSKNGSVATATNYLGSGTENSKSRRNFESSWTVKNTTICDYAGGGTAGGYASHNTMQPTSFINILMKL